MMLIQSLRRVLKKYVSAYYFSFRTCSQKFINLPSDLYILHKHRSKLFSSLDPHIDVEAYFKNIKKLKLDLQSRNLSIDVDDLHRKSISYQTVVASLRTIIQDLKEIRLDLKKISTAVSKDESSERTLLQSKLCEMESKLAFEWQKFEELEESFIIPFLQLPNNLHKNSAKKDEVLFSLFPKPQLTFPVKSHTEIGLLKDALSFPDVSPFSYYMKGRLAALEIALGDFVLSRFKEIGFRNYATPNAVKAFVVQGCGLDTKANDEELLKILDADVLSSNQTRFLVGGASLPSFVVMLFQAIVQLKSDSPFHFISVGRKYQSPDSSLRSNIKIDSSKNLFTALQSTCVSSLVAYPCDMSEEAIVNEFAMMLTQIYTELGLHFILIQYGAPKLRTYESLAIGVCMFSPYYKTYIEVGRISLCQDYISKRLQIYQGLEKGKAIFLGMVYVEILDMKNWIGCMMENTQTSDQDFIIPECLKSYML